MHYWSVKNSTTDEIREQLTDAELVSFLATVPADLLAQWMACRSDHPQWFPCSEFPAFRLRKFGIAPIPSELAMTPAQVAWLEQQLEAIQHKPVALSFATPPAFTGPSDGERRGSGTDRRNWADRRQHPRKNIKLQVVLISDKQAFRTFTKNISMGGMALERAVPESLLGTECTIFLSEPGQTHKFSFTGTMLTESDRPGAARTRIAFGQIEDASRQALGQWIEAAGKKEGSAA